MQATYDRPLQPPEPILVHPETFRRGQVAGIIGPNGEINWDKIVAVVFGEPDD